jgi:D-xylose 1-dehydrogenase (NADP+, D-xylono-1,5-lactone-forming)
VPFVKQAISSRSKEKAEAWKTKHEVEGSAYGSHEALFADDSVDVVYLPLPTGVRSAAAIAAASKKKCVLSEKPAAVSAEDLMGVIGACKGSKSGVLHV